MAESVKQRTAAISDGSDGYELNQLLAAVVDALQAVAAKLDADAGVTDTDYASTVASHITD
jgi:hypothetical protein